ncbi:Imm7 family immunity protein [Yinghuangia soli]|uniref:Immunity 7 family protein n=1 Tax=Yinghuangia soli TaxID=2908204 RepID=A0AA41TWX5_9ACTN|nr:Imm7 family immunity protein [Yinghuangia soli]MCF2526273.1 immunity 7 family protein [Yinghuangia soli]
MFEYHGWVHVLESAGAEDEDDGRLQGIAAELRDRIREIDSPYLLDLRWMNGELFVHFGGMPNHRHAGVIAFFGEVGRRAPGSYGLLHVHDDEWRGHENEFRVFRMVRGSVAECPDALLSPCIPLLEDPFPATD